MEPASASASSPCLTLAMHNTSRDMRDNLRRFMYDSSLISASQLDQEEKDALINILNMLSSSKIHPTTTPTLAASSSEEKDNNNRWYLLTQIKQQLFDKALVAFGQTWAVHWLYEDGYYQCDNVVSIWPKIRKLDIDKRPLNIQQPADVGQRIKDAILELKSPVIEGEPEVYGIGFVRIKLSGNWMAENIHKMLRDGIDTWAPIQTLTFKSTIVNSPSWDESNLTPMDVLRRQLIIMSRMHMLEYAKSTATTSSGNGMSLPPDILDKHFRTVEEGGEVLIYPKDEGNTKPLIRGKSRSKECPEEKSGCFGYPLEDLGALWHGLVHEETDWIVCITPSQQQDYVEECFNAAEHAGWTTTESFWPLATYIGFKTCSTSLQDLLSLLSNAQYPCEAGEAAKVLGYTDEAVLDCALTYTFLKYHRLADCKFSEKEMLDIKGDTFVHLLTTQAQIRKITNHSRRDIDELKRASKLGLEKDRVIWSEGVERELGLHLILFSKLINESYLCMLPHILCRYLYDLCGKFSRFYEAYASSGFVVETRLMLCEATAVVMEKGFHLLGITQKPSLKAVSAALALSHEAPLKARNPLKNRKIRTRFEVFTVYIHVKRDFDDGKLFGCIKVSDYYGLQPDGHGKLHNPGPGRVFLFDHDTSHSVKIRNNGRLEIGDPSCRHSVSFAEIMLFTLVLYATTEDDSEVFQVCNIQDKSDFSDFLKSSESSICGSLVVGGGDGHMRMYYILLRDAVDATISAKWFGFSGRKVCGTILAYYDKFEYGDDALVGSFYKAALFEPLCFDVLIDGDVPLTRSVLAVPSKGSLVVEARLIDFASGEDILRGKCVFEPHCHGSYEEDIRDNDYTLKVQVTWSDD